MIQKWLGLQKISSHVWRYL